ncbi:hypothetical protein QEN19_001962 [Hanseniaspora menglaensis]
MSTLVYGKYKIKESNTNDLTIWYINDVLLKNNESVFHELLTTINSIKRGSSDDTVNIPILANNNFKGIFKKKINSQSYTSFNLKMYDGPRLKKDYLYTNKIIDIPQLKEIYETIDEMAVILDHNRIKESEYNAIVTKLNTKLDLILKLFNNENNQSVCIQLDKKLTILLFLKKDSMIIRFKLKDSLTTIGYINDPFVINLFSKIHHLKDTISLLVWNFSQLTNDF